MQAAADAGFDGILKPSGEQIWPGIESQS